MGFLKNWRADRNNGKLRRDLQRAEDCKNNVYRDKEDQKELDKRLFHVGVEESRKNRYESKPQVSIDNSSKSVNISKTTKNGINDVNVAIGSKNSKSPKSARKEKSKKSKPSKSKTKN